MTKDEKRHNIYVAQDNIRKVLNDTDEDLWAYKCLEGMLTAIDEYFEEWEI